ncbi:hypothetical protein CVT25_000112 [Psilocybe cyanescens]|uniref:Uncharacterized protein n=1 Tax=Psilocybe cyanescens TaxID=93625 RepID=A0A409XQ79_PSICY|nr:hypothetical protein CVT25_000112 [Psilocybe cyanescens]
MEEQQLLASEQELEQERRRSIAQLGRVTMTPPTRAAHCTRPHNTPTHRHLARSAEVVYTSKRDRLMDPLVEPDDRNRAVG